MIVMLGPVGAGKSAQAEILINNYGYKWISTGNLLRESKDPLVKQLLNSGKLVDDQTVMDLLKQEIKNTSSEQDLIVDGFPRRISQAEWLDQTAEQLKRQIDCVLHISLSPEEAAKRMKSRGRHDDSEESIKQRNLVYLKEVMPVVEYYKNQEKLAEIDGAGTVEEVARRIQKAIGK